MTSRPSRPSSSSASTTCTAKALDCCILHHLCGWDVGQVVLVCSCTPLLLLLLPHHMSGRHFRRHIISHPFIMPGMPLGVMGLQNDRNMGMQLTRQAN